ncbi:MAG: arylamine N-acetyltransferase [Vicinamibacterales bacterium]
MLDADRLGAYLARVGYDGSRAPAYETLRAIHRAHLHAIAYENLDIHLGRPMPLDRGAAFHKLVDERRGGWCYEMNGVFGWVLESLGYDVRYVAGAAGRATSGDTALDNHLVLIVTLDRPYVVDVGFGDGFLDPLPLEPGTYRQGIFEFRLSRDGEWWRMHNHAYGGADSFDFTLAPRDYASFAAKCHELQTSPDSGFVKTTVCERFTPDGLVTLRSATLREVTADGARDRVLGDAGEYARVLRDCFDLAPPGIEDLWPVVWDRHLAWLAARAEASGAAGGPA